MQVRKVFKAGNSFAVSIPSEWVRQMNLEDQPVELLRNDRGEIIVKPLREASPDITPDFVQAVDSFMITASLTLPRVRNGKIGLFGNSMGGGVVLMLNGMRRDIAYVVATSPFVGWTTWGRWTVRHPSNALAMSHWRKATTAYHSTNPESLTFR